MELQPGDRVSILGQATLPCIWYGLLHAIGDPAVVVGRQGRVIRVWRDWVAVDVDDVDDDWWIVPGHLSPVS